jgi:hypothetical protein
LLGQDEGLATLKREVTAAHASQVGPRAPGIWRESVKTIHEDLRLWLESRLPKDVYSLAAESARAQDSMRRALAAAGLTEADSAQTDLSYSDPGFSYVRVELKMFPELPDVVFVIAGVSLPCGTDEAMYAYRFDAKGRRLIVDNHATGEQDQGDGVIELSHSDSQGRRLLLIRRNGIQCGSSWMRMFYTVYRLGSAAPPELLLSSEHTFWLDDEIFVLKPDELLMEFTDTSIDTERRTMLFRYSFAQGAKRLEPVALQPQDFAEEWLTRPWSEMKSMSAPDTQAWHDKFHADFMLGKYSRVAPCSGKPGVWSIGIGINNVGNKELSTPMGMYLLVRDLGGYRYSMEAVGDADFKECPGAQRYRPSESNPWLSVEQLKALPY